MASVEELLGPPPTPKQEQAQPKTVESLLGPPPAAQQAPQQAQPEPTSPDWMDVVSAIPGQVAGGLKQGLGGMAQMFRGDLPGGLIPGTTRVKEAPIRTQGGALSKRGREQLQETRPEEMTFWQRAVLNAGSSLGQVAPTALLGPTGMVAGGGLLTAGRAFDEALHAGADRPTALRHAAASGLLEAGTEAIPAARLFARGTGPFKRLAQFLAADIPGENVAEVGQRLSEQIHGLSDDVTAQELVDIVKDTSAATLIGGTAQSGIASGAHALVDRVQARRQQTPQQTPQETPQQPQPEEAVQQQGQPQQMAAEVTQPRVEDILGEPPLVADRPGATPEDFVREPQAQPESTTGAMRRRERLEADEMLDTHAAEIPEDRIIPGLNLGKLDTEEKVLQALTNIEQAYPEINEARGAPIRWDETNEQAAALAEAAGTDLSHLSKWFNRKVGEDTARLEAAKRLVLGSAENLTEISESVTAGQNSDADLARYQAALEQHVLIQETFSKARAEAGRQLNILRQVSGQTESLKQIRQLIDNRRGNLEDIARGITEMKQAGATPAEISRAARFAAEPDLFDKFLELRYNSMLSGPVTHMVNTTSNAFNQLWDLGSLSGAAVLGKLRGGTDKVTFSEAKAKGGGLYRAIPEAMANAIKSFKTEETFVGGKIEYTHRKAIGGRTGRIVRTPGRLLQAEDAFFQTIAYRAALRQFATREGIKRGLRGEDLAAYVETEVRSPKEELLDRAVEEAQRLTFTNELKSVGRWMQKGMNTGWGRGFKIVVPFLRTPSNIIKFAFNHTLLAPLTRETRANLKAGGARRDVAVSRIALGSMLGYWFAGLAAEGLVTGGAPSDPEERDMWYNAGNQPYSVKNPLTGEWWSYGRLEPLGIILGSTADYVRIRDRVSEGEADNLASTIGAAITANLSSKTWLRGVSDFAMAFHEPERYGERITDSFFGLAVPTFLSQTGRQIDPILRNTEVRQQPGMSGFQTFWEQQMRVLQSRTPSLSKELEPRLDVFGEPINLGETTGPFYRRPIGQDPMKEWLSEINAQASRPPKALDDEQLSPAEYHRLSQLVGQTRKEFIESAYPTLRQMPREQAKTFANEILSRGRRFGVLKFKAERLRGRPPGATAK